MKSPEEVTAEIDKVVRLKPGIKLLPPLTPEQWLARDLPPEDLLLGGVFSTSTRAILAADTGLGKTMVAMAWAFAMALGRDFMHWRTHRPARVLFIDGEMPRDLMKERVAQACGWFGVDAPREGIFILSREDFEEMPPMDGEAGAAWLLAMVDQLGDVDFIIFDNFMSLCVSDLRDEEGWQLLKPLVGDLTRRRIGQLWINHVGHADKSRGYGTKTREWQMDVVMVGEKVEAPGADVAMQLSFPKSRRRKPSNRADFEPVKLELREGQWLGSNVDERGEAASRLPGGAILCLQALKAALAAMGQDPPGHYATEGLDRVVTLDQWKTYYRQISSHDDDQEEARRKAFNRGADKLIEAGKVRKWDKWVGLAGGD